MHPNGIYSKLSQELTQVESRLVARLDALQALLEQLLERSAPASPAETEDATPKPRKAPK
jgi:hypothetical protein